jgi:V/A-type H+-transporting ATPase subunit D
VKIWLISTGLYRSRNTLNKYFMNLRFQYNKTSLQTLNKQLNIRRRALPTLKNKESALRMEVKLAKERSDFLENEFEKMITEEEKNLLMWEEFDTSLCRVKKIEINTKKIAGVETPELKDISFYTREFDVFANPKWFLTGIEKLKSLMQLVVEKQLSEKKQEMLEYARKKTTQKVNLYEKVQIPAYEQAILKIKRFLEDEENLTKAAQKIVKNKQQKRVEAAL